MYSYALLEPECYYLVQEKENDALTLLQVKVETDTAMYVVKFRDTEMAVWKKKTDNIHDIIELLSDEDVKKWREVYYNNEDAFYEEDED
ncbi:hypothetical protein I5907_18600 [Panacibacter sp. DH6]|uniref:Uncharacterized protein n=1 Tax=Panacibacter microcysteis TaxID=2793269 RepID=A0A931GZJ1_9BACT|nr:hypothetical protein [Panacibacter microcysteis]MBG9378255.1 hypothetical protein [Panacibacter microcysteis]